MDRILRGTVSRPDGPYFVVDTDGPPHLRSLHLIRSQLGPAVVGDTVELIYRVTPSTGLWVVNRVVPPTSERA